MGEVAPLIQECYAPWLNTEPDLAGRLLIRFVIGPGEAGSDLGRVQQAEIRSSELNKPLVEGCVLNAALSLEFEAVEEPVTVEFPFLLRAPQPD